MWKSEFLINGLICNETNHFFWGDGPSAHANAQFGVSHTSTRIIAFVCEIIFSHTCTYVERSLKKKEGWIAMPLGVSFDFGHLSRSGSIAPISAAQGLPVSCLSSRRHTAHSIDTLRSLHSVGRWCGNPNSWSMVWSTMKPTTYSEATVRVHTQTTNFHLRSAVWIRRFAFLINLPMFIKPIWKLLAKPRTVCLRMGTRPPIFCVVPRGCMMKALVISEFR